jgi:hypothetical protein
VPALAFWTMVSSAVERNSDMRGKLLFVAGLAAGYVVGARAGRPAYDAIAERIRGAAQNPTVRQVGRKAKEAVEEQAPQVAAVAGTVAGVASGAADAASTTPPADEHPSDDQDGVGSPPKPGPPSTPGASTRGTASTGTAGSDEPTTPEA